MKKPTTYYLLPTTYLSRKGFTLIELLVFSAIFTMVMIAFVAVLVAFTRIQVRQAATVEVNGQSQFLLQTIQRYVEESSAVEIPENVSTSTLKLRMPASGADPTYIYLSGGVVYLRQTQSGQAQALTSNRVTISNL